MVKKLTEYQQAQKDFYALPDTVVSHDPLTMDREETIRVYVMHAQIKLDIIEEGHWEGTDSQPSKRDIAKLRRFLKKWAAHNPFGVGSAT